MGQGAQALVVAAGHRFPDVSIEENILGDLARVVNGRGMDGEALQRALAQADAVMVGTGIRLGPELIDGMQRCRIIVRYGIGVDNVALEAARRRGIVVANVPDYCVDEVADHALALMLAVLRRVVPAHRVVRDGRWDVTVMAGVRRLRELTLGVVGFGRIGRTVGTKASALGMRVVAYDPWVPAEAIRSAGAQPVSLDELLAQADVVTLHCPLTPETRHLLGAAQLARMKPTAYLVNTSRGELVDADALAEALQSGRLAGAALDVLPQEPPPAGHPLLSLDNVVVTPHVAWYSEDSLVELRTKAAQQVREVLLGGSARYRVA